MTRTTSFFYSQWANSRLRKSLNALLQKCKPSPPKVQWSPVPHAHVSRFHEPICVLVICSQSTSPGTTADCFSLYLSALVCTINIHNRGQLLISVPQVCIGLFSAIKPFFPWEVGSFCRSHRMTYGLVLSLSPMLTFEIRDL